MPVVPGLHMQGLAHSVGSPTKDEPVELSLLLQRLAKEHKGGDEAPLDQVAGTWGRQVTAADTELPGDADGSLCSDADDEASLLGEGSASDFEDMDTLRANEARDDVAIRRTCGRLARIFAEAEDDSEEEKSGGLAGPWPGQLSRAVTPTAQHTGVSAGRPRGPLTIGESSVEHCPAQG
eukprot:CAMPEP_0203859398 /NCGR_PEP_ID=MMETSP0359-20131031/11824_1 /ASSEMBLY_ACC=CAM_ASM_000338 /TAXON_ID=268821 /ORGANISM="Scrippsiella Hangoei, Strain SHTV-5" /LENGTH=178 /DNA_ID=CAMNT_0050776305 /DNA_START=41 /DNA_END=575 /DNA_ORIENTATION=+